MLPIKQQLLEAIEAAPDEVLAQTLYFLTSLSTSANKPTTTTSKLDRFLEFLQAEGFYEDEHIQEGMTEIATAHSSSKLISGSSL
ncbi:hypothetical protein [Chamaesiphon sp.]|uniref:hypothetical protein n=1 Tax=Chamaesiphon sp. TaxID=2814140 RepID=UPI0035933F4F